MKNNYKLKQIKPKTSWVKEIKLLNLNFYFKVHIKFNLGFPTEEWSSLQRICPQSKSKTIIKSR